MKLQGQFNVICAVHQGQQVVALGNGRERRSMACEQQSGETGCGFWLDGQAPRAVSTKQGEQAGEHVGHPQFGVTSGKSISTRLALLIRLLRKLSPAWLMTSIISASL